METTNSTPQLATEISAIQEKLSGFQDGVRLSKSREAVEGLQTKVSGLSQRIAKSRTGGYVFEKDLEKQAVTFVQQWAGLYPGIQQQLNIQASGLQAFLRPIETQMLQLNTAARNPASANPLLVTMKSTMDMMEDKVTSAEKMIGAMYDKIDNQVYQFEKHINEIEYLLKNLAEASFRLHPTEAGIAAVKAIWCKIGKEQKDDPEGVLFLTDQRLIFEQKEEVVIKKVMFVVTEKQKVQQLQIECPVACTEKVETSKQGLLKNEDHVEIHFSSGASMETVHFHIWQDNVIWQQLINRALNKDFDKDRAVAIDENEMEKVKAAPSQCPGCGGNITQVILRGMDSISCEYCGYVIRL
jgi:hypothetical protein